MAATAILSYSLAISILLLFLAPVALLVVNHNSFHRFNRFILLSVITVSFLIPSFLFYFNSTWRAGAPEIQITLSEKDISENLSNIAKSEVAGVSILQILIYIYFIGISIISLYSIIAFIRLTGLVNRCRKEKSSDYTLCLHNNSSIAPFSFMRFIVISESDYQANGHIILLHETTHISNIHWIDLIYLDLAIIFLWYNPIIWLLRNKLRQIHEYEADQAVINHGINAIDYQKILITTAIDRKSISFTHSFANRSNSFRKRISMIGHSDSDSKRKSLALFLIPACVIALGAINNNISAEILSVIANSGTKPMGIISPADINNDDNQKLTESIAKEEPSDTHNIDNTTTVLPSPIVDQEPLAKLIKYSISISDNFDDFINKKFVIELAIDENGKITNVDTKSDDQNLNVLINEAFNKVEFEAYNHNGKPIKLQIALPISMTK